MLVLGDPSIADRPQDAQDAGRTRARSSPHRWPRRQGRWRSGTRPWWPDGSVGGLILKAADEALELVQTAGTANGGGVTTLHYFDVFSGYLNTRGWTMPEVIEVRLEHTPIYQALAPRVALLVAKGTSLETIARATRADWSTVRAALDFAQTGQLATSTRSGRSTRTRSEPPAYVRLADEVTRLHDVEMMHFVRIAERLGVSGGTVIRAYDMTHRDSLEAAAEQGRTPRRGRGPRLGAQVHGEILRLLRSGQKPKEVAAKVGCSEGTVYRALRSSRAADPDLGASTSSMAGNGLSE
jgi:predicted DNA-binding protein (UPF0251 family)